MKATQTRKARQEFRNRYPYTADIAELVMKGKPNPEIRSYCSVTTTTVAAVRANLKRFWTDYAKMAQDCNF